MKKSKKLSSFSLQYSTDGWNKLIENSIPIEIKDFLTQSVEILPQHREVSDSRVLDIVYVLNQRGQPISPTVASKAKRLLKNKRATVGEKSPFTIKLTEQSGESVELLTLVIFFAQEEVYFSVNSSTKQLFFARLFFKTSHRKRVQLSLGHPRFGWKKPELNSTFFIQNSLEVLNKTISHICKRVPIDKILINTTKYSIQQSLKLENYELEEWWYHYRERLSCCFLSTKCNECYEEDKRRRVGFGFLETGCEELDFFFFPIVLCENCEIELKHTIRTPINRNNNQLYTIPTSNVNYLGCILADDLEERGYRVIRYSNAQAYYHTERNDRLLSTRDIVAWNIEQLKARTRKCFKFAYSIEKDYTNVTSKVTVEIFEDKYIDNNSSKSVNSFNFGSFKI